jgi:prevent-host-death family protein
MSYCPWYDRRVETVAISKFKAECLAILERVRRTGQPVLVTRFGKPVAEVVPASIPEREAGWLGRYRTEARVVGDIVAPAASPAEWEVLGR